LSFLSPVELYQQPFTHGVAELASTFLRLFLLSM
jgi:hypothetical protein